MPSRLFTGIDLINYVSAFTVPATGLDSISAVEQSQARLTIIGSSDDAWTAPPSLGGGFAPAFTYEVSGDLDFNAFPSIPDGARITQVTARISGTINITSSAIVSGVGIVMNVPSAAVCAVGAKIAMSSTTHTMPSIEIGDTDTDSDTSPTGQPVSAAASVQESDNFSNEEIFDFSGSPITKAALSAQFGSITIQIQLVNDGTIPPTEQNAVLTTVNENNHTGSDAWNGTINLRNFELLVEFEDPNITISNDGEEVEHGQRITITSPDIDISGATVGIFDDKIIIVEPDSISEDEIVFTVPWKPTDECLECVGDCPDCGDDCITACEEGLDSDACIECIGACFDCLLDCLETRGLAEKCLGALEDDGDGPTPITVLITIPGTIFGGTTPIGGLVVLVADASGIYRIVVNKTNDTVYDSDRDGTTRDVKIPNPFGVTGFIRG